MTETDRIAAIIREHIPATRWAGCVCGSGYIGPHEDHVAAIILRDVAELVGAQGEGAEPTVALNEVAALREFFWRCWDYARGMGELDGGDIQEWGEKAGLLQKVVANAPWVIAKPGYYGVGIWMVQNTQEQADDAVMLPLRTEAEALAVRDALNRLATRVVRAKRADELVAAALNAAPYVEHASAFCIDERDPTCARCRLMIALEVCGDV